MATGLQGALVALAVIGAPAAIAHGGGLDDRGCHTSGSTGEYHCHQGPHAGESFPSEADYPGARSSGGGGYDRDDYHSRWLDRDGDCQDTREEVLIQESREPVEFAGPEECDVVAGEWHGLYTGQVFHDPSELDIDHLVPLKEAHQSGAADWAGQRKHRYANDLRHPETLIAVEKGANRSKGADDPAEWMPPDESAHCLYLKRWIQVKREWDLEMDVEEREVVNAELEECGG